VASIGSIAFIQGGGKDRFHRAQTHTPKWRRGVSKPTGKKSSEKGSGEKDKAKLLEKPGEKRDLKKA